MSGWGWCAARGGLSVVVCVHGLIAFACTHSQPYRKQTAQVTGPVGVYVIRRGRALDPFPLCDALAGFGSCLESPRCGAGASALAGWRAGALDRCTRSLTRHMLARVDALTTSNLAHHRLHRPPQCLGCLRATVPLYRQQSPRAAALSNGRAPRTHSTCFDRPLYPDLAAIQALSTACYGRRCCPLKQTLAHHDTNIHCTTLAHPARQPRLPLSPRPCGERRAHAHALA